MGPVLFNLYINDLHYYLDSSDLTLYADDTTTLCANKNIYDVFNNTQQCLFQFQNWANANFLSINTNKTKYLLFSPRPSECIVPYDLQINNTSLERQNTIRYLGLIIDDKLKYDAHVTNVCTRLSRAAGVAYAVNHNLTVQAARNLYFSFAHSILSYLLLFWGSTFDLYISRVQVMQNKIIRHLFANKIVHVNTDELYHKLGILKVKDLYYRELGISFYKALYLKCYDPITESLSELEWTHNYNTRKINAYRLPQVKSASHTRHLVFAGVQFWNSLPLELRSAKSLTCFKSQLKHYFLTNYIPP